MYTNRHLMSSDNSGWWEEGLDSSSHKILPHLPFMYRNPFKGVSHWAEDSEWHPPDRPGMLTFGCCYLRGMWPLGYPRTYLQ